MKTFKITITASCFGTREDFYETFMKGNRVVELEEVEFDGNDENHEDPQHNAGILTDLLTVKEGENLVDVVKKYYYTDNDFRGECFSVRDIDDADKTVVLTEDDI